MSERAEFWVYWFRRSVIVHCPGQCWSDTPNQHSTSDRDPPQDLSLYPQSLKQLTVSLYFIFKLPVAHLHRRLGRYFGLFERGLKEERPRRKRQIKLSNSTKSESRKSGLCPGLYCVVAASPLCLLASQISYTSLPAGLHARTRRAQRPQSDIARQGSCTLLRGNRA